MAKCAFLGAGTFMLTIALLACNSGAGNSLVKRDVVVVDAARWLSDGEAVSWRLEPGMYKAELTASDDGASLEWIGSNCPSTGETRTYSGLCELSQPGQILVRNPSGFGLGSQTSVTLKVTRMAR